MLRLASQPKFRAGSFCWQAHLTEKRMLAALDHADIMGLITFAATASLMFWAVGYGLWSHFDKSH